MFSKLALAFAAFLTLVLAVLVVMSFFKKDMIIGHRTLHHEHEAIMTGVVDNNKKLTDLNRKMDLLLNIATCNVNRVCTDYVAH